MRRRVVGSVVVVVGLVLAACGAGDATGSNVAGAIVDVSAQQAAQRLRDAGAADKPVVLDIRTPAEFAAGHVEGAVNVDFRAPDFETRISALDRDATYLVYCRTGNRSGQSMKLFERLGFRKVLHLAGGTSEWTREGLPLVP